MYTTNEEDQQKAAELKTRLAQQQQPAANSCADTSSAAAAAAAGSNNVPTVSIDEGANKYVLIRARKNTVVGSSQDFQHFVVSSRTAKYHQNAAEPIVNTLERNGYSAIEVLGGGRIHLESKDKKIAIFGFSYGFGQADHDLAKKVVQADPRYNSFAVTTSNQGY